MNNIQNILSTQQVVPLRPAGRQKVNALTPDTQEEKFEDALRHQVKPADGITSAEQEMIEQFFPPVKDIAIRVYGPERGQETLNPAGKGKKLDIQG